jgi:hypothetical protein
MKSRLESIYSKLGLYDIYAQARRTVQVCAHLFASVNETKELFPTSALAQFIPHIKEKY